MVENNVQQTEIGVLPTNWEVKELSSISTLKGRIGWQGLKQEEFTFNSDQPFLITGMNFKNGKIRWNEVYHVPLDRYEIAKDIQLKDHDVLMTKDGTIGKILFVDRIPYPFKATLNSHLLLFRPITNQYLPLYLYYNLQSKFFFNHIEENKSGSTFFGISQESVGKYLIPIPPLSEQKAIAEALSDTDAWIESLEQLIAKMRLIKQGAMQELLRPKEGWVVRRLGEVLQFGSGKDYKHLGKGEIPVYGTGGLLTLVNDYLYDGESVGIGRKGTIDSPIFLKGKFWTVDTLFYTHSFIDACPKFIYYSFLQIPWREYNEASGVPSLNKKTLEQIEIPFPCLGEQNAISGILSDIDTEIERLENQLTKARQIKQGMMQDLLTGRIRLI